MKRLSFFLLASFLAYMPALSFAGQPVPGGLGMQPPASPQAEKLHAFHDDLLMWIITAIAVFVLILLVVVILFFNKHVNPTPKQFSHNVLIEVIWTVIPLVILLIIVIPSIQLLYFMDRTEEPDMHLKIVGYQWYWGYEYPDHDGISFSSYMIPDEDIKPEEGQVRLLSVDNPVVLPINKNIVLQITAGDVLHSWAVPALGVKMDAMPGRLNETWVRITKPGVYYGQCSELCGKDHSYMPIEIRAVTQEEFDAWVEDAKLEFGALDIPAPTQYAAAINYTQRDN